LFAIDGAFELPTANELAQGWTFDAALVWCSDNSASHLGPSTTLERQVSIAAVVAGHSARVLDPSIEVTVLDGLSLALGAVDKDSIAHDLDGAHVLIHNPLDALLACPHVTVVLPVELGLFRVLFLQFSAISSKVGSSLSQELLKPCLGSRKHADLSIEIFLHLFKNHLILHHLHGERINIILVLAPHERQFIVEESAIWRIWTT